MNKAPFFISRSTQIGLRRIISVAAILSMVVLSQPMPSGAATLTTPHIYLSRQQTNLASGVTMEVYFTTVGAVSGGTGANKVIIIFPNDANNNTKWCRTAGTLTVSNPGSPLESGSSYVPGSTPAGSCTQTPDTFTITGLDNLSATTKYRLSFTNNTAVIGTANTTGAITPITMKTNNGSSDIDTASTAVALITSDQVSVTATVNPTLTVSLSGTSVALGTLASTTNSYSGITSTVTTNAASGYVSEVLYAANGLYNGSHQITDAAAGQPDNMVAGTEMYGASSSQSGNAIGQFDSDSNNCDGTTRTTASNVTAYPITTAFKVFASNGTQISGQATTLCFLATISGTTQAGSYSSTSTLVTTAKF